MWGWMGGGAGSTPLELAIKLALINFSNWFLIKAQKVASIKFPKLKAPKVAF
jgi:hypothetical protein